MLLRALPVTLHLWILKTLLLLKYFLWLFDWSCDLRNGARSSAPVFKSAPRSPPLFHSLSVVCEGMSVCLSSSHGRSSWPAAVASPHSPTRTCGPSSRPLPLPTGPPASGPGTVWPENSPLLFLWAPAGMTAELLDLMDIWVALKTGLCCMLAAEKIYHCFCF